MQRREEKDCMDQWHCATFMQLLVIAGSDEMLSKQPVNASTRERSTRELVECLMSPYDGLQHSRELGEHGTAASIIGTLPIYIVSIRK